MKNNEDGESKKSKASDAMCMREIVSPFRNLRMRRDHPDGLSPEQTQKALINSKWTINPIQMAVGVSHKDDLKENKPYGVVEEEDYSNPDFYQSPGGPYSPCESPVRNRPAWVEKEDPSSPVISPGKIKEVVSMRLNKELVDIMMFEQRILDNSPSRIPKQDKENLMTVLQVKKDLRSKSTEKGSGGEAKRRMNAIEKLLKSMEGGKRRPFGERSEVVN